jgi:hypothetical protein
MLQTDCVTFDNNQPKKRGKRKNKAQEAKLKKIAGGLTGL